jgi:YebC/PmpR family DNA-binding regulatory protein
MSAVRQAGSDPDHNLKLKYAIEKARAGNMPKDNIERVIKRAAGEKGGAGFEEIVYEGYAPGGVAILVACLTDNRARTAPDIRYAFDRHGGSIGAPGSVSFLFTFRAIFVGEKGERDEDGWTEIALEAGAEDVKLEGDVVTLVAPPADFLAVKQKLEAQEAKLLSAELGWMPGSTVAIADKEAARKVLALIEALEANDDVQNVYANYDIPEEWASELAQAEG